MRVSDVATIKDQFTPGLRGLLRTTGMVLLISAGVIAMPAGRVIAADLTWDGGTPGGATIENGNGSWNDNNPNQVWNDGTPDDKAFNSGDNVTFGPNSNGSASTTTVTVSEAIDTGDITFAADPNDNTAFTIVSNGDSRIITGDGDTITMDDAATINAHLAGDFIVAGTEVLTLGGKNGSVTTLTIGANANVEISTSAPGSSFVLGGTVTNQADGTLTNLGTMTGTLDNAGTFSTTGTVNDVNSTAGSAAFSGSSTGDVDISGGTVDLTGAFVVDGSFTLGAGVTGGLSVDNDLTVDSFDNSDSVTITAGDTLEITGGGETFVNNAGASLDIDATGTLDGDITHNGTTLTIGGTVTGDVDANENVTVESTGDIDGELDIAATKIASVAGGADIGNVVNAGTFDVTTAGTVTIDSTFGNTGTLDFEAAGATTLDVGTALTNDGAITNTGNGAVTLDVTTEYEQNTGGSINAGTGSVTITAGLIDLNAGTLTGTVTLDGDIETAIDLTFGTAQTLGGYLTNEGAVISVTAAINAGGEAITNDGGDFNINTGGSITNAGVVTNENNGTFDLVAGTSLTATSVSNETGADFTIAGTATVTSDFTNDGAGSLLTVDGTVTGGVDNTDTATVDIGSTGSISGELDNDATVTVEAGAQIGSVDNSSTFDITTAGTVTVDMTFVNTGTLDFEAAGATTLDVGTTLTNNGAITNTGNGAVTLDAATEYEQNTGGSINAGTGSVTITAGLIDLNAGTLTGNVTLDGDIENAITLTFGAVQTLGGSLTNESTGVVNITAAINAGGEAITNDGGDFNINTGGSITDAGVVTNENDGTFDLVAGTSLTATSVSNETGADFTIAGTATVTSNITNDGAGTLLTVDGTVTGDVDNTDTATVDVNNGGSITGELDNDATATVAGDVGSIINQADGDITFDGTMEIGGTFQNEGLAEVAAGVDVTSTGLTTNTGTSADLTIADTGSLIGNVTNELSADLDVDGTLDGDLTNSSAVDLQGIITGNVDNNTGGDISVVGDSTIGGTLDNADTVDVEAGFVLTVDGLTTNESVGEITVNAGSTMNGDITNDEGATLTVDGGTLGTAPGADPMLDPGNLTDLQNAGTFDFEGTINGTLDNLATGETTIVGVSTITGAVDNANVFDMDANLTSGAFTNGSTGTVTFASGTTLTAPTIGNEGTFDATAGGTITLAGDVTSSGTIDMENDTTGDQLVITGLASLSGTTFNLDVDLTDGATSTDAIDVQGALSGSFTLAFNLLGTPSADLAGAGLDVLTYGSVGTGGYTIAASGLPTSGTSIFFLSDDGAGAISVQSQVNSGLVGIVGTASLTQSLIGSVINRPTSPFVAGLAVPADKPCGTGAWGRLTGGVADASAQVDGNTASTADTIQDVPISASYAGFQLGSDFSCFGGYFNGWDLSFGGIIGMNLGNTSQDVFNLSSGGTILTTVAGTNETDFTQTYLGAYVSAFRKNLLIDMQYRVENTDFDLDAFTGSGAIDQSFSSQAQTVSGSASYVVPINQETLLNFVPTLGFSYTSTATDNILTDAGGFLQIDDSTTAIGFVGGSLSKTQVQPSGTSALTYFGTATYYNDFSEGITSTLFDAGGVAGQTSFGEPLGSFGEVSLGVNYTRLLTPGQLGNGRQLNASVRVDGRFGESLESWGVTAQARIQF